ncbi:MAG TPA: class I SAM-dependent methyltransferase [Kiritimatiellia bacterium]|nr:class I SAM-dependent methyltransferase [Kiritimatiellia bacterium]
MFGQYVDYYLLKTICHKNNLVNSPRDLVEKNRQVRLDMAEVNEFIECFDTEIVFNNKSVLDIGCGDGALAMQIAAQGACRVVGIDIRKEQIAMANNFAAANNMLEKYNIEFIIADVTKQILSEKFDIIVSLATFEHVSDMKLLLSSIREMLVDGGLMCSVFGPLYHSAYGDHFGSFFKYQIPYRGVLFNEMALLRLYREFERRFDAAETIYERDGGMNKHTYDEFVEMFKNSGLDVVEMKPRVSTYRNSNILKYYINNIISNIYLFRNYIAASPVIVLRK